MRAKDRLFVALDVRAEEAHVLINKLVGHVGGFKINSLFVDSPGFVSEILKRQYRLFLDLKGHDIPNTVHAYAAAATCMRAFIYDVHCSGGVEMMKAAVAGSKEAQDQNHLEFRPLIIGITVLTSMDDEKFAEVGLHPDEKVSGTVLTMARKAQDCGLDGVVASPQETEAIRKACGPWFVIINPGIRPAGAAKGDQVRVGTPASAIGAGATFLVVGRPIIAQPDPAAAADAIVSEMNEALQAREVAGA